MTDPVDLLIKNAWLVATMDDQRRELTGDGLLFLTVMSLV